MKGIYISFEIEEIEEALKALGKLVGMVIDELKAFFDDHSIFMDQWHDIGNCSYRDNRQKIIKNLIFFLF